MINEHTKFYFCKSSEVHKFYVCPLQYKTYENWIRNLDAINLEFYMAENQQIVIEKLPIKTDLFNLLYQRKMDLALFWFSNDWLYGPIFTKDLKKSVIDFNMIIGSKRKMQNASVNIILTFKYYPRRYSLAQLKRNWEQTKKFIAE